MCFHTPSRPRKMDKFLFFSYRNTYKIRHYKKDNGNPPINYFIYEFHNNRNTCPTKTEFVTCYPLAEQTKIYLCTIQQLDNYTPRKLRDSFAFRSFSREERKARRWWRHQFFHVYLREESGWIENKYIFPLLD